MKKGLVYLAAIAVFCFLITIGEWAGLGTKDPWDDLMDWARKKSNSKKKSISRKKSSSK